MLSRHGFGPRGHRGNGFVDGKQVLTSRPAESFIVPGGKQSALAFRSNASLLVVVRDFVKWLKDQADSSYADLATQVIDISVYRRNSCLRLVNQSKLGKRVTLALVRRDTANDVQLIDTMASYVPADAPSRLYHVPQDIAV